MEELMEHTLTFGNLLDQSAEEFAKKTAISCGKTTYTYAELKDRVQALAVGLSELGIGPHDRVAILMGNSIDYMELLFAVAKLGAVTVPINTFLTPFEVAYILKDSGASCLVGTRDLMEPLIDHRNGLDRLSHLVVVDEVFRDALPIENLRAKTWIDGPMVDVDPDQIAAIMYTSGTTGRPKGAMLSHANILMNMDQGLDAIPVLPEDRMLVFLPMFHIYTITACIMAPLHVGCTIELLPSVRPFSRLLKTIALRRPSLLMGIPPLYNILVQKKIPGFIRHLNPLRLCFSAAAPLSEEVRQRFEAGFGTPLLQGYGLSEASPAITMERLGGERRAGAVGLPVKGIEVRVVDEDGNDVPLGETGEIIAKGPNIMKGYLNLEEETRETIRDGWLYTGDMAKMDEDGYVYIVDRKKDMILVHGMNVYSREVECILDQHPAVEQSAVVGKREEDGERVVAVVQLKVGKEATPKELRAFCQERLANFKVPHQILFRDSLPMTPTLKVKKKELREEISGEAS